MLFYFVGKMLAKAVYEVRINGQRFPNIDIYWGVGTGVFKLSV